jgi:hypothetical protein
MGDHVAKGEEMSEPDQPKIGLAVVEQVGQLVAKLWASKPQPSDLVPVLHRPLEPAGAKRTFAGSAVHL